jgi:hypothetical protein
LADDDGGSALFDVARMAPGVQTSNCIAVTYRGSDLRALVKLSAATRGDGLAPDLDVVIEAGRGGHFNDCSGFTGSAIYQGTLAAFASQHRGWSSGLPTFSPSASQDGETFRFTFALRDDPRVSGLTATVSFSWEAGLPDPTPVTIVPAAPPATAPALRPVGRLPVRVIPGAAGRRSKSGWQQAVDVARAVTERSAFPLILLIIVAVFLVIQDQIDRRDPKLALAPVYAEPDVGFRPLRKPERPSNA